MQECILIVDDEPDVIALLKDYFEWNGYRILTAADGEEAVKQAGKQPDLILLDVNMPGWDGLTVCRKIRDYVSCPILFLTAKIEDSDKIKGFASGGDDYILKPFSIEELGARVAAHIRRERRQAVKNRIHFEGELVIDYTSREVRYKDCVIGLAPKEFEIVELLSVNRGQIFDKERIYETLWGYDSEGEASVVVEHIRRIRAKFTAAGANNYIETVWGVGYKWVK
ncbi:response regulator transcription factor [Anaerolentibacter hominis]|uniref:response regulator transcription factor n=1 Tax=Anaerolentibacter hominis TaxID=3079009 RepID=UPI0031B8A6F2